MMGTTYLYPHPTTPRSGQHRPGTPAESARLPGPSLRLTNWFPPRRALARKNQIHQKERRHGAKHVRQLQQLFFLSPSRAAELEFPPPSHQGMDGSESWTWTLSCPFLTARTASHGLVLRPSTLTMGPLTKHQAPSPDTRLLVELSCNH